MYLSVLCLLHRGVWAVQCLGQCVCAAVVAVTMVMGHWTLPHTATHCHTLPATRDKTAQPQSPIDWPPYLVHQVERRLGLETSQAITAIRQDPAGTVF